MHTNKMATFGLFAATIFTSQIADSQVFPPAPIETQSMQTIIPATIPAMEQNHPPVTLLIPLKWRLICKIPRSQYATLLPLRINTR